MLIEAPESAPTTVGEYVTVSVSLAPAAIGVNDVGEKVKAADPVKDRLVISSGTLPVFDIVTVLVATVLTFTLLNVNDKGDTLRIGCSTITTPVPEALTVALPTELVMLIVAVLAPEVAGLKATVNVWLAPALIVSGVKGAVRSKSVVLLLVMLLTVRAVPPVLDMVTVCVADVVPTVWFAYVRVAGDTLNAPAATPEPEALTVALPTELVTLIVAVLAPEVAGLKATVNVWLAPALIVSGVKGAVRSKSVVLLLVMLLTVRAVPPVLDMVTVCVADVVPTVWFAYVRVAGDTLNAPAATPEPEALTVALQLSL